MIRIVGTIFAGLLGLAFGSFLNVCLSRWPEGESVVAPRSHCRNCDHTLSWWENFPILSWLLLRGRCRKCGTAISWRYPLVEIGVGASWALGVWREGGLSDPFPVSLDFIWGLNQMHRFPEAPFLPFGFAILTWLLVALAALDVEYLWLPDWLTIPGIILGFGYTVLRNRFVYRAIVDFGPSEPPLTLGVLQYVIAVAVSTLMILVIRWLYKLFRHREGIGLGDAKLMAMLAAWLGLPGALLAFVLGAVLGSLTALVLLVIPHCKEEPAAAPSESREKSWAATKLPLGTFLCIGGIISSLWGQPILNAYFRWAGF
jgi:leader peptidase (prepilin peptidase)/N-methyltransferase